MSSGERQIDMITAVDTNILLDVLIKDSEHLMNSKKQLLESKAQGSLIISPPVYSELFTQFSIQLGMKKASIELENFLAKTGIYLSPFTKKSLEIAGIGWTKYVKSRVKDKIMCPKCGKKNLFFCDKCNEIISWRNHIITDFLIGGHAKDSADRLLTRDRGYYKRYFPELEIGV